MEVCFYVALHHHDAVTQGWLYPTELRINIRTKLPTSTFIGIRSCDVIKRCELHASTNVTFVIIVFFFPVSSQDFLTLAEEPLRSFHARDIPLYRPLSVNLFTLVNGTFCDLCKSHLPAAIYYIDWTSIRSKDVTFLSVQAFSYFVAPEPFNVQWISFVISDKKMRRDSHAQNRRNSFFFLVRFHKQVDSADFLPVRFHEQLRSAIYSPVRFHKQVGSAILSVRFHKQVDSAIFSPVRLHKYKCCTHF
jgi:hypothetical protein